MTNHSGEIVEPALHFQYPIQNDPMLNQLRDTADIKIDLQEDDLEKAKNIIGYAHRLFSHDGDNTPTSADPLTILTEAQAGQSFRCVEYSTLAAGLLWAHGIPTRTIGLKTRDVETREYGAGHVAIEFWSHDHQKWIMSDVQAGVIPYEGDEPLSALELAQGLDAHASIEFAPVLGSKFSDTSPFGDKANYTEWIKEYLYYIDTPVKLTLGNEDKREQLIAMLVPVGEIPPQMFQNMFKMNAVYTNEASEFYTKPV